MGLVGTPDPGAAPPRADRGPWTFGGPSSFIAAPVPPEPVSADEGLQRLVLGYLGAFGPASVADIAQFTLLKRSVLRAALGGLTSQVVEREGPDGSDLFDIPDGLLPAEDIAVPPRLLPMWDSILLAYADRSRIIPPEFRRIVIRPNGDVLPSLLVDGHVAGVGDPSRAASRRPRSGHCPTMHGADSRGRPLRSWRSWPSATPWSTADTVAGGRRCPARRCDSCPVSAGQMLPPRAARSVTPMRGRRSERPRIRAGLAGTV